MTPTKFTVNIISCSFEPTGVDVDSSLSPTLILELVSWVLSARNEAVRSICNTKHKLNHVDFKTTHIKNLFAVNVFSEEVAATRLPKPVFKALQKTIRKGMPLDPGIADAVATAMKDWAMDHGATHYTHIFQPMTGVTAEKHDSFLAPTLVVARRSLNSAAKNSSKANPMPARSPAVDFAPPLRRAVTPRGTRPARRISSRIPTVPRW